MVLILLIGSPCARSIFRILMVHRRSADRCATHMCDDRPRWPAAVPPYVGKHIYRIPAGTTLMLLNGEPLINFVLTTV